jgi:selenocysteine lyase/cysteine desulfurase
MENIYTHESNLCEILLHGLESIPNVIVYRNKVSHYLPIVSFNFKDVPSNVVGEYLNSKGFCVRSGFHCSALAHKYLNTTTGTVRFSPSMFNTPKEVHTFVKVLRNFDYNKKN